MTNYLATPLAFIVEICLSLYMIVIALRLIMQWANWDHYNPLAQFIIKATQTPVRFLRQFIPAIGRWDTATIVLLVAVTLVKLCLLSLILGQLPYSHGWFFALLADIFSLFINVYTVSIIVEVILSWLTPAGSYNPIAPLVIRMNAPLLSPLRRTIPPIAGIDLSPLFALIALQVLSMLVMPLIG